MRTLIDGYNLLFAGGHTERRFGPDEFRQVRQRFLDRLAVALDAAEALATTVVFDAVAAPRDRPSRVQHRGITILFAVDRESADEQIEDLIAHHSSPKTLTVVSSDIRIKTAAHRRRSKVVTADEYWTEMDRRQERRKHAPPRARPEPPRKVAASSLRDPATWEAEFADVDAMDEAHELFHPDHDFITDADLARVAREVEAESRR